MMLLKPGAALLFDIDGTLVESDPLHLRVFNTIFGPRGHHFDHARFSAELQGVSNEAIAARFLSEETAERQAEIMQGKEAAFRELAAAGVAPVAGLMTLMDWADAHGVPMAAVTNAPRANAELLLDSIGMTRRFQAIVIGEELMHGKPHPLPYIEGLRRLGADAAHSVAFEDSRTGIASATAAGIATVGIATSLDEPALLAAGAQLATIDFADPRVTALVASRLARD